MTVRNERLRAAFEAEGLSYDDVGEAVGVDPKTVGRWVTEARIPYPRHRVAVARLVGAPPAELWPEATTSLVIDDGLKKMYPRRSFIPVEVWVRLLATAKESLDALAYAGLFLPKLYPDLPAALKEVADGGGRVRLLLGDPESEAVALRSREEGIGDAIPHKVRNALAHYQPIFDVPGIEVRLHGTTLYSSIYRFDDEMLVSSHVLGLPAAQAPAMHLRRGDLFDTYAACFERTWDGARPVPVEV